MERAARRDLIVMVALVAVGCAITIAVGERIGINRGEGWDGQAYTAWAKAFPPQLLDRGVTEFQGQRVLPSALVYYALSGLGIARTGPHVILAFQILAALALVASAALLARIAVILEWSRAATWAAFAATFLGFANARHALYYPTLTDPMAFALAMAIVWAYLGRRPIALWVVTLASAFTWPALVLVGFATLVLPRTTSPLPATTGRWHRPVAVAIGVATTAIIIKLFFDVLRYDQPQLERWITRSHRDLWIVTIGITVLTSAVAAYIVARQDRTFSVLAYLRQIGWLRPALGCVGVALIIVARRLWVARVATQGPGFGFEELQLYYVALAVRGPLWNVIHHIVYFGPIIILAIGVWSRIAATSAALGPAALVTLAIIVLSSVSPDARHLLHLMPFLIVTTIAATATWWTPRRAIAFVALGVVWSKLWLRIGYDVVHDSYAWPDLRYFMQHASWASDTTFLVHLGATIVTAALLWLLLRRPPVSE